ncbi:hypothetical protein [Rhizobium sp. AU243]|uniref:AAA family ATPase n=1 Tax=Rhizobium sp. AU243 TaxID=2303425 RepID=UPI00197D7000
MLIVLGGLPGSGKSTVAQALARQIRALVDYRVNLSHVFVSARRTLGLKTNTSNSPV